MKNKHILKLFIAFLKQKGVYNAYLYALSKGEHYRFMYNKELTNPISFIIQKIKHNPHELIADAFDWYKTKYNVNVWWALNNEWFEYLKKNVIYGTKR